MMIEKSAWGVYVAKMSEISSRAGMLMAEYINKHDINNLDDVIAYAYALSTRYGYAIAELACQMYEAMAEAEGVNVDPAEMADEISEEEVAQQIKGAVNKGLQLLPIVVYRLVKLRGADTTLKNAVRDGCEYQWVALGDTCAFCLAIASEGWKKATADAFKNGHAQHIHGNCDCQFMTRHKPTTELDDYDPQVYQDMLDDAAPGETKGNKIKALRKALDLAKKTVEYMEN